MKDLDPNKPLEKPPLNPVIARRASFLDQLASQAEAAESAVGSVEEQAETLRQIKETYDGGPKTPDDPEYFKHVDLNSLESRYQDYPGVEKETDERQQLTRVPSEEDTAAASSDTVTLTVRGKTIIKPRAEVDEHGGVAVYQRELAADDYLQEARGILEEAKQIKRPPPEPAPEEHQSEDEVEALARAIRVGTDEEANAAVKKLLTRSTPQIDVTAAIDQRVQFRSDAQWFQSEYKDILNDPIMARFVMDEDERQVRGGDGRPYGERYKELGDKMRHWRDGLAKTTPLEDKRQRKASVQSIPSASVRARPAQVDEGPEDPRSVIAQMRKVRGQA